MSDLSLNLQICNLIICGVDCADIFAHFFCKSFLLLVLLFAKAVAFCDIFNFTSPPWAAAPGGGVIFLISSMKGMKYGKWESLYFLKKVMILLKSYSKTFFTMCIIANCWHLWRFYLSLKIIVLGWGGGTPDLQIKMWIHTLPIILVATIE